VLRTIAIVVGALVLGAGAFAVVQIGPRNVIGMLLYDRRREGALKVGDRAPDLALCGLDGSSRISLLSRTGAKPLVIVFGSFT